MPADAGTKIDTSLVSINALKVLKRLTESGFQAYLVGGSVRDLLLGKSPKDFDVSTDAHPEQVRELFRNSRMVGKRFRIVHVRFGREIVEVATFRASREAVDSNLETSDGGMILSDNDYGTFEEDVFRRDFTINGLYYNADDNKVTDLVDGLTDLKNKVIRLIGEPTARYREDPVRMLRAMRFAAKLDFTFEPATGDPIRELGHLLQDVPAARLFEEFLKLFMSGQALSTHTLMEQYDIFQWLFPGSRNHKEPERSTRLTELALQSTDRRISEDLPVTPAFIIAAILWQPFIEEREAQEEKGLSSVDATWEAGNRVLAAQQLLVSIPKRFSIPAREIWNLQFRLPIRNGKRAESLVSHKRFRAAYDFLLLREESGEPLEGLGAWWTQYQEKDGDGRQEMVQSLGEGPPKKKRKRKPRRRSKGTNPEAGQNSQAGNSQSSDSQSSDSQSGNSQSGNSQSSSSPPSNSQSASSQRGNSQRGNSQRSSSQRSNSQRGNGQRGNSQRGNSQRGNSQRGNSQSGNTQSGNSQRGDSQPGNSKGQSRSPEKDGNQRQRRPKIARHAPIGPMQSGSEPIYGPMASGRGPVEPDMNGNINGNVAENEPDGNRATQTDADDVDGNRTDLQYNPDPNRSFNR
jgi:poly(A) polymerase